VLLCGCALLGRFVESPAAKGDVPYLFLGGEAEGAADLGMNFSQHAGGAKRKGPSRLILDGGGRRIGKTAPGGSLLEVGENMELTVRNLTLEGVPGSRDWLVKVSGGGKLILEAGVYIGGNGSGVYVESGTLIMRDGIIDGMESGCGVRISVDGAFIMEGGTIKGNGGGGVFVDGGSFTMNSGTIRDNRTGGDGGGVHVDTGSFTLNSGVISDNTASGSGGGVRVTGVFTMNNGIISGNAADGNGGGVYVESGGAFVKNGGVIFGTEEANAAPRANTAMGEGAAAYVYESASRFRKRDRTAGAGDELAFHGVGRDGNTGWEQ
jgi:hypothetical protein